MKSETGFAKKLRSHLRSLGKSPVPEDLKKKDPVEVLVRSFLLWQGATDKADAAFDRLRERIVDFNDLRVSMPNETVGIIGERYPLAMDRAQRLRAALRDLYEREHRISMAQLAAMGKRDLRKYVESLEGIVPYVSSRVLLLCFDVHTIPVDEQLRSLLIEAGAADPEMEVIDVSMWLAKQISAGSAVQAHFSLQAWVDDSSEPKSARSKKKSASTGESSSEVKQKRKGTAGNVTGPRKGTTAKSTSGGRAVSSRTTKRGSTARRAAGKT